MLSRGLILTLVVTVLTLGLAALGQDQPTLTVTVNPGVLKPIVKIKPEYPAQARGIKGKVVLKILIGTDGTVEQVEQEEGDRDLGVAAKDAVKRWKYEPFTANKKPVRVITRVWINFN